MRDVLLAEVTLKIKKTWHIKWQLKSVKHDGYFCLFYFSLFCFRSTLIVEPLFVSLRLRSRRGEGTGSFFSARGGTGKALLWFTSSPTRPLCSPECHRRHSVRSAIALCQHRVAMTTHTDKCGKRRHRRRLVKAPRCPLGCHVPFRSPYLDRAGSPSMAADQIT